MNPQAAQAATALTGMFMFFMLTGFALFILWIMSLIDVIKNDFTNPSNKTMWLILLIFIAPIGTILYLFIGRNHKTAKETYSNVINTIATKTETIDLRNTDHRNKDETQKWF